MLKRSASLLLILLVTICAHAQKKSKVVVECLEGNCKDGIGLVKVYCSAGLKNQIKSCQMDGTVYYYGEFRKGEPSGRGRLAWTAPNYSSVYRPPTNEEIKSAPLVVLLDKDVSFVFDGEFRDGVPDGEGAMGSKQLSAPSQEFTAMGLPNWSISLPTGFGTHLPAYKGTREFYYGNFRISDNTLTRKWKQKNAPLIPDYFKTQASYYEFRRVDSVVNNNGQIWAKVSVASDASPEKKTTDISKMMHERTGRFLYEERDITKDGKRVKPAYRPSVRYYLNGYAKNGWVIEDKVTSNRFADSMYLYRVLYRNGQQIMTSDIPFPLDEQNWAQLQLPDGKRYEGAVNEQQQPHGFGETSFQVRGVSYYFQGYFANGRQVGPGILVTQGRFRTLARAGDFENFQLKRGYVELDRPETSYYWGPYSDSAQIVYGRLVFGTQREFKGLIQLPQLIPNGNGVYTFSNGVRQEGYFNGDQLVTGVTSKSASQLMLHEVVRYKNRSSFVVKITSTDVVLANGMTIAKNSGQPVEIDTQHPYYQFTCSCKTCGGDGKVVETRYAPPKEKVTNYYAASTHMAGMYEYVGTQRDILYGTGGKYNVGRTCQECNGVGTWICKTEIQ